jgi:UrcA family protein
MKTKNLTARVSGAALIALAALPMVALATGANAATTVKVGDLNLLSDDGVAAFHARAEVAARAYCDDNAIMQQRMTCKAGVKTELNEKLGELRQSQLAKQSTAFAAR